MRDAGRHALPADRQSEDMSMTMLLSRGALAVKRLTELVPDALLLLVARLGIAAVFFQSGRTKT